MRSIIAIMLLLISALLSLGLLGLVLAFLANVAELVADGEWSRLSKGVLITIVVGVLSWFSSNAAWRRRADLPSIESALTLVFSRRPHLPLTVFLGMAAAALVVAALIVAFAVNTIELPAYAPSIPLPWDPTHTAEKYLFLGVLAAVGAYWVYRTGRPAISVAMIPALMLTLAVPVGAAGYESVANRWSYTSWYASSSEMARLKRDRYVYMQDRRADSGSVLMVRPDVLEGLQYLRATGARGDWSGLEELESEADVRKSAGRVLLFLFAGLTGGAGWLLRKDWTDRRGSEPGGATPPEQP